MIGETKGLEVKVDLLEVAKKRSVPGILILDHRKEPIFFNPVALDTLSKFNGAKPPSSSKANPIKIAKEISNLYDNLKKSFHPSSNGHPGKVLSQIVLIPTPNETFCCRGFFIQGQDDSTEKAFHIMVLIEKMSPRNHADLEKFIKRFDLTERQIEIVRHLIIGESNKTIADKLCICEDTVKGHMSNIMRQLKVNSRIEILSMMF